MTLADFTGPGLIILHLQGRDVAGVIQELSEALHREKRVPDLLPFYRAALDREFLVSSEMEEGMAFPHARLKGLQELSFAFGRADEPLVWGAKAFRSVRLVFLMAVPPADTVQYLSLISGLARLAKERTLLGRLQGAPDTRQILEVLQTIQLRTNSAPNAERIVPLPSDSTGKVFSPRDEGAGRTPKL